MPTFRRSLLDKFLGQAEMNMSPPVIEVGGVRGSRRGAWAPRIDKPPQWCVLNPDPQAKPDFLLNGEVTPFKNEAFNSVLCAEVLEVVAHPEWMVEEMSRLLSAGGTLVLTVPFLNQIHPHPDDYQRWTDKKIADVLQSNQLEIVSLDPMGSIFAVIYDLILAGITRSLELARLEGKKVTIALLRIARRFVRSSFWLWALADRMAYGIAPWITTGWAVVAVKTPESHTSLRK